MPNLHLDLIALDQSAQTLWSFDSGDATSLHPLPVMVMLPFVGMLQQSTGPFAASLLQDRLRRAQPHSQGMTHPAKAADEEELDESEEIGLLDAADIACLQHAAQLQLPCDQALPAMRDWLDQFLAVYPAHSALGESWWCWLQAQVAAFSRGEPHYPHFAIDFSALFAVGQVFDRVMDYRFSPLIDWAGDSRSTDAAVMCQQAPMSEEWQDWVHQMQVCLDAADQAVAAKAKDDSLWDAQTQQLHLLRQWSLAGDFAQLEAHLQPADHRHQTLIDPAYKIAVFKVQENDLAALELRLARNRLWLISQRDDKRLWVLRDQIDLAYKLRHQDQFQPAVDVLELTLQQIPQAAQLPELRQEYGRLLMNLSFLYIKLVNAPRKAYDLLQPVVAEIDAAPQQWDMVDADIRAKLRANLESSRVTMVAAGMDVADLASPVLLTAADRAWLDAQDTAFANALNAKESQKALTIAEQVLQWLTDKNIPASNYNQLSWRLDQGRALRDLGKMAEAIHVLEEVVSTAEGVEHMHAKSTIPRATIALAICYRLLGQIDEAKAVYLRLINGPLRRQEANSIQRNLRIACNNLAELYQQDGDFSNAHLQKMNAAQYAHKAGMLQEGCDHFWEAFELGKKARNWAMQHRALTKLRDEYQHCADRQIKVKVKQAIDALKILGDKDWTQSGGFNGFVAKLFGLKK